MTKFQYSNPAEHRHEPLAAVVFMDGADAKGNAPDAPWAVFEDGLFETDDEKVIARLKDTAHVSEYVEPEPEETPEETPAS